MDPIVSWFFLLLAAVFDNCAATNSSAYLAEDDDPQKLMIREGGSIVDDGRNSSAIGGFSPLPSSENILKFLSATPSVIRDGRLAKRKNHSEVDHSNRGNDFQTTELSSSGNETPLPKRFKSASYLRLLKTSDNRIIIRNSDSDKPRTTRTARKFTLSAEDELRRVRRRERQNGGGRRRIERFLYDSNLNSEKLYKMNGERNYQSYKIYPDVSTDHTGDRYYYNDFGSDENPLRPEEFSRPFPEVFRENQPIQQKRFHVDSCRKYLEFLKFAFEQLDAPTKRLYTEDQDEYYYYDDDYNKAEPKMLPQSYITNSPPVITPDMTVLHRMAVTNYEIAPNGAETASVSGSDGSDTEKRSSELPETKKSSTVVSPKPSPPLGFQVPAAWRALASTEPTMKSSKQNATESYKRSGISSTASANETTPQPGKTDSRTNENCQDKLFPCPDNVNVTYPVNGYCNRFVACESGKPQSEFCQEGLHFNLVERRCDLPHNSFCTYSCPFADGYFAVPGDCGGFFRCSNWYPEYRMCPPRMHWDSKAKICTFEELSSCPLKCDSPYQVKPYRGVCNAYVICTRNVPKFHQCPEGSHFDGKELKCSNKLSDNCTDDENYIARNRGIENGKKTLCADVELKDGGRARWCQETSKEAKS